MIVACTQSSFGYMRMVLRLSFTYTYNGVTEKLCVQ